MKTAKTNRVYSNADFTVIYKCPHCSNDSMVDMSISNGAVKIHCEMCGELIKLKWKFKP